MPSPENRKSLFRPAIDAMSAYVPGEQPKDRRYIKLNTNENPYPPCPAVVGLLRNFDPEALRLYPDPEGCELRGRIAALHGLRPENVLLGNGSDDILNIAVRCFAGEDESIACFKPSYSLYPVLARIQGCSCTQIRLDEASGFSVPEDFIARVSDARLFIACRPNAPTGNSMPRREVERLCGGFKGAVLVDEAYADFSEDNCVDLLPKYPNMIIARTLSKSYSLAGLRLGYALASPEIIDGMMKVKDSYNVGVLVQKIAMAAISDQEYLRGTISRIKNTRAHLSTSLLAKGFKVCPSESNFVFASPPGGDAEGLYLSLKSKGVLVRYFAGEDTGRYVRISVGTDDDIHRLLELI